MTVIDTPGFGDTQGIERDKQITEQIRVFFTSSGWERIDRLDAVGFVAQSSLPRLTTTQKYIFDSILSLFGKDMADNIFLLLTFADAERPQILDGIKAAELPYKKYFKFNNSALYACFKDESHMSDSDSQSDEDDDTIAATFWKMGMKNFQRFMREVINADPKSLVQTKEVLKERSKLELSVEAMQVEIKQGLNNLDNITTEIALLEQHGPEIDRNETIEYEVAEDTIVKVPTESGQNTTNCLKCSMTCHEDCMYSDDRDKQSCVAMSGETCHVCPGKCYWKLHRNLPYVYAVKEGTKLQNSSELRNRLQDAEENDLTATDLMKKCIDEFSAGQLKILVLTEEVRKSVAKLEKIALRPQPLSHIDYIDLLIEAEKGDGKPGWNNRVKQLNAVRDKAVCLKKAVGEGCDPFDEYKKKIGTKRNEKKQTWVSGLH